VNLPAATIAKIETMALDAFTALGCKAWARVDFMLDDAGEPHFIECNTAPGMWISQQFACRFCPTH